MMTETEPFEDMNCPRCGMAQRQWSGNDGQGYTLDGQTYCCRGCAEGTGCVCGLGPPLGD